MMRIHEIIIVSICSALIDVFAFHNSWTLGIREQSTVFYYTVALLLAFALNLPLVVLLIWQRRFVVQNVKRFLHKPKQGEAYRVSMKSYVCILKVGSIVLSRKIGGGI